MEYFSSLLYCFTMPGKASNKVTKKAPAKVSKRAKFAGIASYLGANKQPNLPNDVWFVNLSAEPRRAHCLRLPRTLPATSALKHTRRCFKEPASLKL